METQPPAPAPLDAVVGEGGAAPQHEAPLDAVVGEGGAAPQQEAPLDAVVGEGGAAPQQEAPLEIPKPPYNEQSVLPVRCYMPNCKCKPLKTWCSVVEHLRNTSSGHGIAISALRDTYLHKMARDERSCKTGEKKRAAADKQPAEAPKVDKPGPNVATPGVGGGEAMEVEEGVDAAQRAAVDKTLLKMPGRKLGKVCVVPTSAVRMLMASGLIAFQDGGYEWSSIVPVDFQEEQLLDAMPDSPQRNSMADILGKASKKRKTDHAPAAESTAAASGLHRSAAEVTLKGAALDYQDEKDESAPKTTQRGQVRKCPWKLTSDVDISAYRESVYAQVTVEGSRTKIIGGLMQFLSLFVTGRMPLEQFLEQLADTDTNLMAQALNLKICGKSIPWTNKMMTAVQKACAYTKARANAVGNFRLANKMEMLIDEYVDKRLAACSQAATEKLAAADEEDFEWLENFAPVDKHKAAVEDMMRDLAAAAFAQAKDLPGKWKLYATVCMTGITFMGQCNSRPGPWEFLTVDTLQEMKQLKRDYWTAIKGVKMLAKRGATGRYMCPGCVTAADVYAAMRGRTGNRLWLYAFPKLHDRLGQACKVYLPGHSVMTPTAMRQFWETKMHHDQDGFSKKVADAKESMANAMDHGEAARDKSYVKGKARKVASDSKACTIAYFDGEVAWPTSGMSDDALEERASLLSAKFAQALGAEEGEDGNERDGGDEEAPAQPREDEDSSDGSDSSREGGDGAKQSVEAGAPNAEPAAEAARREPSVPTDPLEFNPDTAYDWTSVKYQHIFAGCGTRTNIPEAIHAKVHECLKKWQRANGVDKYSKPAKGRWYWNLRCFFIDSGDLTIEHGWGACRNSARDYTAKLKKQAEKEDQLVIGSLASGSTNAG